jgi:hypothetical protein
VLLEETRPAEAALEVASRLVRRAKLTRNTVVVESGLLGAAAAAG